MTDAPERITAAALRTPMALVVTLPAPARHHDVLHAMHAAGFDRATVLGSTQGFLTSRGRFVDRTEGWAVALQAGQETVNVSGLLFSEDLW